MLDSLLFWLLCLGHLLGDYYFQSERMARGKQRRIGWLLLHCLLYALAMGLALSPVLLAAGMDRQTALLLAGIPAGSHAVIDCVKAIITRGKAKDEPRRARSAFVIDQLLHIAAILGVAGWYGVMYGAAALNEWGALLRDGYALLGLSNAATPMRVLRIACMFLAVGKPANIAIRKIIAKKEEPTPAAPAPTPAPAPAPAPKRSTVLEGRPHDVLIQVLGIPAKEEQGAEPPAAAPEQTAEDARENARTGRWIGVLERVLVLVLMMTGEYGAIGLVFTAKSLTRFERIAKDKGFAEYYLIGTLASILFAMGAFFIARPLA